MTMISVIAWIGAFMFTALFCFAMCFCFGEDGGSSREGEGDTWITAWITAGDPLFDDLIRMQICATIQRIQELTYQEIQLKMRLVEEGETNNVKLKKKLQRVTAKIEKARRKLEESRLQAEDIGVVDNFISLGLGRMDNNDTITAEEGRQSRRKEIPPDRKELIEKNLITIKYGLPHHTTSATEEGEEKARRSKVIVRDNVYCSTKNTSVCEENYCCFEANNNDDDINDVPPHTDECIICLDEYHVGDILVKSKQDRCIHQFHKECMLQWLRNKHEQCPLCRVRLLVVEDEGTTKDDMTVEDIV